MSGLHLFDEGDRVCKAGLRVVEVRKKRTEIDGAVYTCWETTGLVL